MAKETFVIAGGSTGVAKQVVVELVKKGCNVVFGDTGDVVEAENFLNTLKNSIRVIKVSSVEYGSPPNFT